jgi:hypothetical protein
VEPLLKWGLALPLQLFALAFQELALGSEKGTCAPPFGFTKVSAMWPADVMARTRTADANLFSRLELGSSGTHGHLSHTDCTQTCRRTGVMAPGVVTAGHLRLASAMGRDHCSSSSSSSSGSLARTTFTLSAFGIALPVYTEGLRLRPAITDLANLFGGIKVKNNKPKISSGVRKAMETLEIHETQLEIRARPIVALHASS